MIADDFKAIRERRNQIGGHDIIKEYVTPASERELTPVEKMRREAAALAAAHQTKPLPGTISLGKVLAGTLVTQELLDSMLARYWAAIDKLPVRELPPLWITHFTSKPTVEFGSFAGIRFVGVDPGAEGGSVTGFRFVGKNPLLAAAYKGDRKRVVDSEADE